MPSNYNESDIYRMSELAFVRQRCKLCGRKFFREEGFRGHFALVNVLGWKHRG